ncbi:hypothetical protein BCAR13_410127 [Paraburkholderia caribensis]|nr:hypothetical protein BCAR13_410127 [Paraburkholderia caribensis]
MSISGLGKALDQSEILKEYLERSLQLLRKAWQANSSIGTGGVEYVQHAGQISHQYLKLVLRHKFSIQDIAGELERSLRVGINRDRGEPHGPTPPTPPCVRVRTRRFGSVDRL